MSKPISARLLELLSMTEEWRPVVGYEGIYEVSNTGRVRSLDREDAQGWKIKGRDMKLKKNRNGGHLYVGLTKSGKQRFHFVHRLMVEAFRGPIPEGLVVRHLGDNPELNFLPLLEVGTVADNAGDAMAGGRDHCPRGHRLEGPNLIPSHLKRGWRECLACSRAGGWTQHNRPGLRRDSPEFKEVADRYYAEIVSV